ncbi:MAG: S9 family peptidase, partial [Ignavibacteria bacterium]|nr:S9 family peptidase [Ignavibacteria bacterium]
MKFISLLLLLFLFSSLNFSQKKAFEIEDLYKIKNLSGISVNKEGTKLLFTVSAYYLEKGKSETNINLLDIKTGEIKPLTNSEYSSVSPVFSNVGKGMFFLSSKTGSMQLFYLPFKGGEIEQVTDFYSGISDPKISRDGKLIVFSANVFPECGEDFECSRNIRENLDNGPVQAYMADSLMIRHWTDYKDGSYTHIITFNLETKTYKDITPGYWDSPAFTAGGGGEFDISPDSKEIVFTSKRVDDPEYSTNVDIFIVNIDGTGLKNITHQNKAWDSEPKYSPDGKYIAYKSQKTPGYESDKTDLNIYNRKSGKIQKLTEKYDYIVNEILWSSNSKNIFFSAQQKGYFPIFKCEIRTGKISSLT